MAVTWNPSDKAANITLSGGNLTASASAASEHGSARATQSRSSGKFYFEVYVDTRFGTVGLMYGATSIDNRVGGATGEACVYVNSIDDVIPRMSGLDGTPAGIDPVTLPGTLGVAVDLTAGKIWFAWNGTWISGGNPGAGTGEQYSGLSGTFYPAWSKAYSYVPTSGVARFAAGDFAYSAPSGFSAWESVVENVGEASGVGVASGAGSFAYATSGFATAAGSSSSAVVGAKSGMVRNDSWNPADKDACITLSNGAHIATDSGAIGGKVRATLGRTEGRYYFEAVLHSAEWGDVGLSLGPEDGGSVVISITQGLFTSGPLSGFRYLVFWPGGQAIYLGDSLLPLLYVGIAVDLYAGRYSAWFESDSGGRYWSEGAIPPEYTNPPDGNIGPGRTLYPTFVSSGAYPSTCALFLTKQSFIYPLPDGYSAWDDYEDFGEAKGQSSASSSAGWFSDLVVGASVASSSADASGEGLVAKESVASAGGASTMAGLADIVSWSAQGASVVSSATNNAQASASGSSAVTAFAARPSMAAGSAQSVAVALGRMPTVNVDIIGDGTLSVVEIGDDFGTIGLDAHDGETIIAPPDDAIYVESYIQANRPGLQQTITWASNRTVSGVRLYNSSQDTVAHLGSPTGNEEFDPVTGGFEEIQVEYDTTGSENYATVVHIYDNKSIRKDIFFPEWLVTRRIRITAYAAAGPFAHVRLVETQAFTPVILIPMQFVETLLASDTLLATHRLEAESAGVASSAVVPVRSLTLTSVAAASDEVIVAQTVQAAAAADGIADASARSKTTAVLTSSAEAGAILVTSRSASFVSTGVLAATSKTVTTHTEVSTGDADSTLTGDNAVTSVEESTGVATDTVIGIRRVTVIEESGAIGAATAVPKAFVELTLQSSGRLSAINASTSVQHATLVSEGAAESVIQLPFIGDYPLFWSNSTSTGGATWAGLPFNSMVEVGGIIYGAGQAGLFKMIPDADDPAGQIEAEVEWDLGDFRSVRKKRVRSIYVEGVAEAPFTVRVVNEQGSFDYRTSQVDTPTTTNHRAALGRGLTSRQLRLSLLQQRPFGVGKIGLGILESTRRI